MVILYEPELYLEIVKVFNLISILNITKNGIKNGSHVDFIVQLTNVFAIIPVEMFWMLIWGRDPQTTSYWKLLLQPETDRFSNLLQANSYRKVHGSLKWGKCTNQHVKKLNHSGNNQLETAVYQYESIFQPNLKLQIYTVNLLVGDKHYIIYCIYLEYFTILFYNLY